MKEALALCSRKDPKYGDPMVMRPGLVPVDRTCSFCKEDLIAAPSTVAMEGTVKVTYACNPCGNRAAVQRGVKELGIAPGALSTDYAPDRRRRNELEAHGFKDIDPNNL